MRSYIGWEILLGIVLVLQIIATILAIRLIRRCAGLFCRCASYACVMVTVTVPSIGIPASVC